MSGTRPEPGERRLAEQHLGDRLSALVDGELGHDARERVLAHLATCAKCKAEADAQRQLKSVFAEAAPPSPSESFLARLQGLPGGDLGGSALGGGGFGGFSDMVDAVGGVDICLDQPIKDPLAGIDLPAGCQELDGPKALGFVRTRAFATADLQRVQNQRKFLSALFEKVKSPATLANPFRVIPLMNAASGSVSRWR